MTEQEQRAAVIAEALTWQGTPHHNGACIKGAGVDCGQLPWTIYHKIGVAPAIDKELRYSPQFHLSRGEEWYKAIVEKHGYAVEKPQTGDLALYKIGRIYSHGAIVIEWPRIIHAWVGTGVIQDLGDQGHLKDKHVLFYSPWKPKGIV